MSEEILINVTPSETRVAVVGNGVLQEVLRERTRRRGLCGNVYKGRISRVLPGMRAAFIDIALERNAFLHASEMARLLRGDDDVGAESLPQIREMLHEGRQLLVQVTKDPLGSKGARLTTNVSLPSRYLVLLPFASQTATGQVGVSEAVGQIWT